MDWIVRFVRLHSMRSREHLFPAEAKIESFLTDLAVHANVAPATQNQAMNALVFLYKRVLNHPLQESINAVRADRKINVPVVMTREEVAAVRTISAWHVKKLSKKDRGVKIVKGKNLIKGVPNPDLENGNRFSICHCESRQKRKKVRACALKRYGAQAWQSPWKNRDCFASLAKTVS